MHVDTCNIATRIYIHLHTYVPISMCVRLNVPRESPEGHEKLLTVVTPSDGIRNAIYTLLYRLNNFYREYTFMLKLFKTSF